MGGSRVEGFGFGSCTGSRVLGFREGVGFRQGVARVLQGFQGSAGLYDGSVGFRVCGGFRGSECRALEGS